MLVTIWGAGSIDAADIGVLSLQTGEVKILIEAATGARYSATGHLVYATSSGLLAVPFDLQRLELTGAPAAILDGINLEGNFGATNFSFSDDGSLVYLGGGWKPQGRLAWVDRDGDVVPLNEDRRVYEAPRLSPDDSLVAVFVDELDGNLDVWVYDIDRSTLTLLTYDGDNSNPVWMPDGERIAFSSSRLGNYDVFWKRADGSDEAEALLTRQNGQFPMSSTRDGRYLGYYEVNPDTGWDLWVLPTGGDRVPEPFLVTSANERAQAFSPDGRWLAYVSDETGRDEIYVQAFPGPGGKQQISPEGGREPHWAASGREIFYRNDGKMMAAAVQLSPEFRAAAPETLFEGVFLESPSIFGYPRYDVTADGQRFLMVVGDERPVHTQLRFVFNWFDELRRLAPTAR